MLEFFLESVFDHCIKVYLRKYAFKTSTVKDVWATFYEAAIFRRYVLPDQLSVQTIMDSWTKQTGYPLVTVTANYETDQLVIEQVITIFAQFTRTRYPILDPSFPGLEGFFRIHRFK